MKKSLSFKILVLAIGVNLLLGLSANVLFDRLIKNSKHDVAESFRNYASSLETAIAAQFFERYGDVQAFAINPDIRSSNREVIIKALNNYAALYGIYDLIMVVSGSGKLVAVNNLDPSGNPLKVESLYEQNYSNELWFKNVMDGKFTNDKERNFAGTYVEDPQNDVFVEKVTGKSSIGSSFSAPILDSNGKILGVITNRANLKWIEGDFVNLYKNMSRSGLKNANLQLINKDGTVWIDFEPKDHKYDLTINRDPKVLGIENRIKSETEFSKNLKNKSAGFSLEKDPNKNNESRIFAFSPVTDNKFIPAIGWSVLVSDDDHEVFSHIHFLEKLFYIVFTATMLIGAIIAYFFSKSLSKTFSDLANRLSHGAEEVTNSSAELSTASTELSMSATEQAAALQETAAAIDEISAMVNKNAENSKEAQGVSKESLKETESGLKTVQEMIESMQDIEKNSEDLISKVSQGNDRISEIVKVIEEIGSKTKVINDIVFQTKLLSFNASVEAARAGEHGKGFAVVAEEVGNLAQMSGNASKEISKLLEESVHRVNEIVTETKSTLDIQMRSNRSIVESGNHKAKECGKTLEAVLECVTKTYRMAEEIATASQEQSVGIQEITKAMAQLDQVTNQNSTSSQNCAGSSTKLKDEAVLLHEIVSDLMETVSGKQKNAGHSKQNVESPKSEIKNNVLSFNKKKAVQEKPKSNQKHSTQIEYRTAVGGGELPSKDDPRFEDI